MRTVGIIAEYNPLHNGHVYHLQKARELSGADYCIVVLSGNFVQRGECACADKYVRAEWAIRAGADLVVELPSVYAVSSAERFALGAVRTLISTGIVTDLAFGCEEENLDILYRLNDILVSEPPAYREALRRHLKLGKSYPRARFDALAQVGTDEAILNALSKPNNILAVEYLRAISLLAPSVKAHPILRVGSDYHQENLEGPFASATAIRSSLSDGSMDALTYMPAFVGGAMRYDASLPLKQDRLNPLYLYAMRRLGVEGIADLPDVSEGFENVFFKALQEATDWNALLNSVKTKRFTMARLKRIGVCALLGINNSLVRDTIGRDRTEYLKVLALSSKSRGILSLMSGQSKAPVLLRNSDFSSCAPIVRRNLSIDSFSSDVLAYGMQCEIHRDGDGALIV